MTLLLTRGDLEAVREPAACLDALREGFRRAGEAAVAGQRVRTDLPFPGTATTLIPGVLPGIEAYTVKVNAKFPGARPALRGVICLHSGTDGELLALLDSATVTAWRTGLAAALGTQVLAGSAHGAVLGVIGAGAQAELMVRGLAVLRGHGELTGFLVHDTASDRAAAFAARHGGRVLTAATDVAAAADVVLLATWSRAPLLRLADTREGQHFTSLGADEPGKRELAADLLRSALLVVDDRQLAADMGALATADLSAQAADATLGEVLRGEHPGRTSASARSVRPGCGRHEPAVRQGFESAAAREHRTEMRFGGRAVLDGDHQRVVRLSAPPVRLLLGEEPVRPAVHVDRAVCDVQIAIRARQPREGREPRLGGPTRHGPFSSSWGDPHRRPTWDAT